MKPSTITAGLGVVLIAVGVWGIAGSMSVGGVIPLVIGGALIFLTVKPGRVATLVFGHCCIVVGAYLITWGALLLTHTQPTIMQIIGRPLFWGIFSIMGGICGIFHGFCRCVNKQLQQFEGLTPANRSAAK